MPVNKSQAISKKPTGPPHKETNEVQEQASDPRERERLSGQGSESALAHLRDIERRRLNKPEKTH